MICRRCGTRQPVEPDGRSVAIVDLPAVRDPLDERPSWLLCCACDDVLAVSAGVVVRGDGWCAEVQLDGSGQPVEVPSEFLEALSAHLNGIVAALWLAPDRASQDAIILERHAELSGEAIAAALLAAEGRLPGWVVGNGGDALATVDDMLGPPQSAAVVAAALSAAADNGAALAEAIAAHAAPGLVMPRAADDLGSAVASLTDGNGLDGPNLLWVLAMHAAGQLPAGRPDPLAGESRGHESGGRGRPSLKIRRCNANACGCPDLLTKAVDPVTGTAAYEDWPSPSWRSPSSVSRLGPGEWFGDVGITACTGAGMLSAGRPAMPLGVERYPEAVWSSNCSSSWAASSIALCRHSAAR